MGMNVDELQSIMWKNRLLLEYCGVNFGWDGNEFPRQIWFDVPENLATRYNIDTGEVTNIVVSGYVDVVHAINKSLSDYVNTIKMAIINFYTAWSVLNRIPKLEEWMEREVDDDDLFQDYRDRFLLIYNHAIITTKIRTDEIWTTDHGQLRIIEFLESYNAMVKLKNEIGDDIDE